MSEHLQPYRNADGSTSFSGQQQAGRDEAGTSSQPSGQAAHESWDAYTTRVNAFNETKQNGG